MSDLHLEDYVKYDYVGAPCTFDVGDTAYVGNGGFSLRKVSKFISALKRGFDKIEIDWRDCTTIRKFTRFLLNKVGLHYYYIKHGFINEDFVISLYLKKRLERPTVDEAAKFCQDAIILENIKPAAYHGWEKNLTGNLKRKCLDQIKT